ncbi:hypothetical protein AB0D09_28320 [Streptomyces sp. NPDC049097]|uniref:hypothetical protein n=1 Tax=Streptomyces sp. NPDC049097 TaxID=3155497 RepID=UPI0034498976
MAQTRLLVEQFMLPLLREHPPTVVPGPCRTDRLGYIAKGFGLLALDVKSCALLANEL